MLTLKHTYSKLFIFLMLLGACWTTTSQAQASSYIVQSFENVSGNYGSSLPFLNCPNIGQDNDVYWIGDENNCTPFISNANVGNFMTINCDDDNFLPGGGVIWSQNVNNWGGEYTFCIDVAHRYNSGTPITLTLIADGTPITDVNIATSTNWTTICTEISLLNGTDNLSLVQTGGICHNCDYAIDELSLCPAVNICLDLQDSNGNDKNEFCYLEEVWIDGSDSYGEQVHFVEVCRRNPSTYEADLCVNEWFSGEAGLLNLTEFVASLSNWTFEPGYLYTVKLATDNCPWTEKVKEFTVECCTNGPDLDASFIYTGTNSSASYKLQGTSNVNYMSIGADHQWYIFSSVNPGGPYTSVATYPGPTFTLHNLSQDLTYTVLHQITTPCGQHCSTQYGGAMYGKAIDDTFDNTKSSSGDCSLADEYVSPFSCRVASLKNADRTTMSNLAKMIDNDLNNNVVKAQKAYIEHEQEISHLLDANNQSTQKLRAIFKECKKHWYQLLIKTFTLEQEIVVTESDYLLLKQFLQELSNATKSKKLQEAITQVEEYLAVILNKEVKTAIKDFDSANEFTADKNSLQLVENGNQTLLFNSLSNSPQLRFQSADLIGDLSIQVYDLSGGLVQSIAQDVSIDNGNFQCTIDKSNLAEGIHLIQLQYATTSGTYQETLRLPVFK